MEHSGKDKVSICIPTRNRPHLLRELLDTVFAQTYGHFDVIITDNSDNDETRDLVAGYADPRVRYHKNETNLGMDGNARRAFSFITGEFFTFTADDDFWDADNLRRKVDFLRRVPEVNACFSNAHHILMDGRPHPQPFHTTLRPGAEAIIDGYYLNPVSLHVPPATPLFMSTLTGLYRTAEFLAPMVESWECGSEEYAHWYLGLSDQRLGFLFDPLVTIRDGEHNWEIQTGNGTVTNYRKSPEIRAAQLNRLYMTLRAKRGAELTKIDQRVELAVFTFLVEQIGQEAVQYIGSFPLITVADFNAYIQTRAGTAPALPAAPSAPPLVSILIPVYNREREIEATIRSALTQTVRDLEVVVVDNASTDGTWAICQRLAEGDPRLRLFRNETNIGPVNNWRRCVAEARGVHAKILFSDDWLEPTYLERTLPHLQDRVAFVFTPAKIVDEAGAGHGTIHQYFVDTFPSDTFVFEYLLNFGSLPVSPCAALFRTADLRDSIVSDLGPGPADDFDAHGAGPDCLIYLIVASRYPYVVHVAEPLVTFRRGGISSTLVANGRFFACYNHALMWFMKSPMAPSPARLAAAALWRQETRNTRRVIPYEDHLRTYGVDPAL